MKELYYVEVVDKRIDLDPPYVWQSVVFDSKSEAIEFGIKVKEEFKKGNADILFSRKNCDYLNPQWENFFKHELPNNRKGIKSNLKVRIMTMEFDESETEYEIGYVKEIK